jgi:hypothetical protein
MQRKPNHACPRRRWPQHRLRPWPALPAQAQAKVAQLLSRLVQRQRLPKEVRRADPTD